MHRYDAVFQIMVGAWTANKEQYANGNALIWSALLPYAGTNGTLPDNMGTTWHSGIYGTMSGHVEGAWLIYEHSGDLQFLTDIYAFYKPLFWNGIAEHWGYAFNAADRLARMATVLGHTADVQHWYDVSVSRHLMCKVYFRQSRHCLILHCPDITLL